MLLAFENSDLARRKQRQIRVLKIMLDSWFSHTLRHTATLCNALQRTATRCNALQHAATHCNALQRIATFS